jgi:thiol-disulfide isomerase/thioredoxin
MRLPSLAFAFIMALPIAVKAQPSPQSASDMLKEACVMADRENKNVLIMFHASWCGWCHKMDKSINDAACKNLFEDNFVIRHLVVDESPDKKNLENPGADEMRKKYHGDGQGIPFWLVFDKEGKLLADSKMRTEGQGAETGQNIGCPAAGDEVDYFISLLKKNSNLTSDQLEIIRKRFRLNEQ